MRTVLPSNNTHICTTFTLTLTLSSSPSRPNGVRFLAPAGTTEFTKRWNPQPGDIVSFKHHGFLLATKKPKFPTIYRLRTDVTWEDVRANWNEPSGNSLGFPPPPLLKKGNKYLISIFSSNCISIKESFDVEAQKTKRVLEECRESKEILYRICPGNGLRSPDTRKLEQGNLRSNHREEGI